MRHTYVTSVFALLAFGGASACTSSGAPAADAGTTPQPDAGGCGASCQAPDAGECVAAASSCSVDGGPCCPGYVCDGGVCALPPNPCPNGEQLLPSGCGCDPTLGATACSVGFVCGADLQCDVQDGGPPVPLIAQPVGAPCEPSASYPDGGAAPPCAQPVAADGGADGGTGIDCVPDPSGVYLYVCAQACATNLDCPLAWQSCNSAFAASGHCGDDPCTAVPAASAKAFFAGCPDGGGLCLPFSALVDSSGQTAVASYGLCLQASDAGPNSVCADPPTRGGALCDAQQLCVLGRCRNPCNAAVDAGPPDAGACLASEVCAPLGVQPVVLGAVYAAGGCVNPCELALDGGGECDAGADAGVDAGVDAGLDAGPDAGEDAGPDGGGDGGDAG